MKNSDLCHFVRICFISNMKRVFQSDLMPHLFVLNNYLKCDGDLLNFWLHYSDKKAGFSAS